MGRCGRRRHGEKADGAADVVEGCGWGTYRDCKGGEQSVDAKRWSMRSRRVAVGLGLTVCETRERRGERGVTTRVCEAEEYAKYVGWEDRATDGGGGRR